MGPMKKLPAMLTKEYIENVKIIYSDSGNIVIKIKAPLMIRPHKTQWTQRGISNGFLAEFYDKIMCYKIHSALSMLYGVWKAEPLPWDSVYFINNSGETMHSAELIWDEREGKLYTDKFRKGNKKKMKSFKGMVWNWWEISEEYNEIYWCSNSCVKTHQTWCWK